MQTTEAPLAGLKIIQPKILADDRGFFYEVCQRERYQALDIPPFVQDNFSHSRRNVIRGLHFQFPHPQGKLVHVTRGEVFDVVLDIRKSSKTFGEWFGIHLDDKNHTQLYIPPGFAHGFCVLSEEADFHYKCTDFYYPDSEHGILWNDEALNISWPIDNPVLSAKDKLFPRLSEYHDEKLFP